MVILQEAAAVRSGLFGERYGTSCSNLTARRAFFRPPLDFPKTAVRFCRRTAYQRRKLGVAPEAVSAAAPPVRPDGPAGHPGSDTGEHHAAPYVGSGDSVPRPG